MGSKNYTDVLIDGKVYTLGGAEEESYLQQVASYINDKLAELRRQPGFSKQNDDYQSVMALLNLADDYFKEREHLRIVSNHKAELEKEVYSLKHELVGAQLRLESAQGRIKERDSLTEKTGKAEKTEKAEKAENTEKAEKAENKSEAVPPGGTSGGGSLDEELLRLREQVKSMKEELEKYRALEAAEAARKNRRDHR